MSVALPPSALAALTAHTSDSDLREVLAQATGTMRYLLDRVWAHQSDPTRFPLPSSSRSLERSLLARLRILPAPTRTAAAAQAVSRLGAAVATRESTYGYAARLLDPQRADAIMPILSRRPIPPTLRAIGVRVAQRLEAVASRPTPRIARDPDDHGEPPQPDPGPGPGPDDGPGPTLVPKTLRLTVKEVYAKDDTNEAFRDEIAIAAVLLDPINRRTVRRGPISLGKFGKGDRKSPGTVIAEIPLLDNANLGQFVLANVFLADVDRGGFAAYVEENEHVSSDEIVEDLLLAGMAVTGAIIGGAVGGTLFAGLSVAAAGAIGPMAAVGLGLCGLVANPVGIALVGAAAALLLGYVALTGGKDEIFTPGSVGQSVEPTGALALEREPKVIFTRSKARYEVTLHWEVIVGAGTPAEPLPPPVGRIEEITPAAADANLRDKVDHVVVLMLENRSFDHVLGYLSLLGSHPDVNGLSPLHQNALHDSAGNVIGGPFGPEPMPDSTFLDDPAHHVAAVARQTNDGAMDGFVDDFARINPDQPSRIMAYLAGHQVPVYDFIAREFGVCDAFHSSFAGNTFVNRTLAFAGTPATRPNGELITNNDMPAFHAAGVPSYFRAIDTFNATLRPGERAVDWRCYSQDIPMLAIVDPSYAVPAVNPASSRFRSMNRFFDDLVDDTLPQVSWLDPNFMDVGAFGDTIFAPDDGVAFPGSPQTANDDHPPVDVAHGQAMIASLLFAMMSSPAWEKLLFVIVYDEHGGFHDHVRPPDLADLGLTPEGPEFATLGCRVPALVVSPWVERGAVCTQLFDHCSLITTILTRFCRRDGAIPDISERVNAADHLGFALTGTQPRFMPVPGVIGNRSGLRLTRRKALMARLGKRMLVASTRPRVARPPTDLERDITEARQRLASSARVPTRPGVHEGPFTGVARPVGKA